MKKGSTRTAPYHVLSFRMSHVLCDTLTAKAGDHFVSLTAEIISRIEASLILDDIDPRWMKRAQLAALKKELGE